MTLRATPPRGGFTLIEVLVVMGIITALTALSIPTISSIKRRAWRTRARAQIQTIESALSLYHSDTRTLPRLAKRRTPDVFNDDAPALCAGLLNAPTALAGGGPGSPYLKTTIPLGKVVDRTRLAVDTMGLDGVTGVVELTPTETSLAATAQFQVTHGPLSAEPLVLVDPLGNPYHYREWESVGASLKEPLLTAPPRRSGFRQGPLSDEAPIAGPVLDRPQPRYAVWSNGPNGVNEFGEGDDIASWKSE